MTISAAEPTSDVEATDVAVDADYLRVKLSDGREISVALTVVPWLHWLATATPAQQANWTIEPGGFAVYWPELDDGVEIGHLLERHSLA